MINNFDVQSYDSKLRTANHDISDDVSRLGFTLNFLLYSSKSFSNSYRKIFINFVVSLLDILGSYRSKSTNQQMKY